MNLRHIVLGIGLLAVPAAALAHDGGLHDDPSFASLERYAAGAQDLVLHALSLIGVHYRRGGDSPDTGFDCSGLVRHVFHEALGLLLPRSAREISRLGTSVGREDLRPGDLVFFNTLRRSFSHVGIYLGEHRFIHAPATGGEVRIEDMRQRYWTKRFNGARRIAATVPVTQPD